MGETAEEQRVRLNRKRISETNEQLIACKECNLSFKRVGSHVVQVHGYGSSLEYRKAHGLMAKNTRLESYASSMRAKAHNYENLEKGKDTRYVKGGKHGEVLTEFWKNRAKKGIKGRGVA